MRAQHDPQRGPDGSPMPVQVRLAALWASVMFLYAYVDILAFYKPGVIDGILAGRVWRLEITQTWAVGALALMALPILMIFLSVTLAPRANRIVNIVVASLYVAVSIGNAVGEGWAYYFALAAGLEVILLLLVVRTAWAWPRGAGHHATASTTSALTAAGEAR